MNKKKILIISGAVVVVVVIAASLITMLINANTVTCSSNNTDSSKSIEQNYKIRFSNDKVTSVSIFKKFAYTNKTQFDAFKSVVIPNTDASMKALANDNIKYSSSTNDMTYITNTTIYVSAAKDSEITKLGVNKSLKTLKSSLESQGLVCKP